MRLFDIQAPFEPQGDQPRAIEKLSFGFEKYKEQTLLGVTGSGKTFTMAKVIQKLQKPALVLSHNKTLAAQLYNELKEFFPNNKVCYFVSYYDYYQPESYLPASDTYIEKDSMINEKIERMRMETATELLTRKDVIIVSSVSCIYGFGKPADFQAQSIKIIKNSKLKNQNFFGPQALARKLIEMQYERNDIELRPGRFRVRGDVVDIVQGSGTSVIRIYFSGDDIEKISELHPVSGKTTHELDSVVIFPAKAFVVPKDRQDSAIKEIQKELHERLKSLGTVESYRLKQRTAYDIEMIEQLGYCKGIENYSRHFDQRAQGSHPFTLLDYFEYNFKKEWLMFIDESHVAVPQVGGMYEGDKSRKRNLIDFGFRLPSAYDNRPLMFKEFEGYLNHVVYVSATPGEYELKNSGQIVEQIIRPTGLIDPPIILRPIEGQVDDLISEVKKVIGLGYRTLVTTLTKRLSEDLTAYLREAGIKAEYLHSEINTLQRNEILKNLRIGKFDVLVGINLLREGLDLPEVALVAILDADKEGFLRNAKSLIQTIGRAARNIDSRVIMYADVFTKSMKEAVNETNRRRKIQIAYNIKHNITPLSIIKAIKDKENALSPDDPKALQKIEQKIIELDSQMKIAAEELNFELAIELRSKIQAIKHKLNTENKKKL